MNPKSRLFRIMRIMTKMTMITIDIIMEITTTTKNYSYEYDNDSNGMMIFKDDLMRTKLENPTEISDCDGTGSIQHRYSAEL